MAIPMVLSLEQEQERLLNKQEFVKSNFWISIKKGEAPVGETLRVFLLNSEGDGLPWKSGVDNYIRHTYEGFEGTQRIFKNILCGTPWGVECPVCDLMKELQKSSLTALRVDKMKAKEDIMALVLDMDEVEGHVPVNINNDGEEEWVHAITLKQSIIKGDAKRGTEGMLQLLIQDPNICSYTEGEIFCIIGRYPAGSVETLVARKFQTSYTVSLESVVEQKGRTKTSTIRVVNLEELQPGLIDKIEKKLAGNELINKLISPFYSAKEIWGFLSSSDRSLLDHIDYSMERPSSLKIIK